jgi:hypothetical protein
MASPVSQRPRWFSLIFAFVCIALALVAFVLINPIDTSHVVVQASPTLTALPATVTPTEQTP